MPKGKRLPQAKVLLYYFRRRPLSITLLSIMWISVIFYHWIVPLPVTHPSVKYEVVDHSYLIVEGIISDVRNLENGSAITVASLQNRKIIFSPKEKIIVYPRSSADEAVIGMHIQAKGEFSIFDSAANPGQFNLRNYYDHRSIIGKLSKSEISVTDNADIPFFLLLKRSLAVLRDSLEHVIDNEFGNPNSSLMSAILLGQRSDIPQETYQLYRNSGIAHLLAISGLHISFVGMGTFHFLRRRRLGYVVSGMIASIVLFLYCLTTGMGVSSIRAFCMFLIWTTGQMLGRKSDIPTALSAAAFAILVINPGLISESSFYLSFACIICIRIGMQIINTMAPKSGNLRKTVIISLSIFFGTLPITAYFYYQISIYSVLINLIVIPMMSLLYSMGMLSAFAGLLSARAGLFLSGICSVILSLYSSIGNLQMRLPCAVWITGRPDIWVIIMYYAGLWIFVYQICKKNAKHNIKMRMAGGLLFAAAFIIIIISPKQINRITFYDVGQGDCIFIENQGHSYLVDCGSSSTSQIWKKRIEECLKYRGVRRLDCIFVTHGDQDHINGIKEYLEEYNQNICGLNCSGISLGAIAVPSYMKDNPGSDDILRELINTAQAKAIRIIYMSAGEYIESNNMSIKMLFPDKSFAGKDKNENSLVLSLEYKNTRFLLTGDMEKEEEEAFCRAYPKLYSQDMNVVLKLGHHGSKYASSELLLKCVMPDHAVVSCGLHNRYGHPADEVIERLKDHHISIHRTDQDGAVIFSLE